MGCWPDWVQEGKLVEQSTCPWASSTQQIPASPPARWCAGVTAQVSTVSAGLNVKAPANRLAMDTGMSSSPRNTVTPRTRVNQLA